jgi:hypothetical protein
MKVEVWSSGGKPGVNFRELILGNEVVLQQMKRQFTRHAQRSGQAYPGRLLRPTIRADQAQTELRPVRTGPVGRLVDCEAAFSENRWPQHVLQQRHEDGRF